MMDHHQGEEQHTTTHEEESTVLTYCLVVWLFSGFILKFAHHSFILPHSWSDEVAFVGIVGVGAVTIVASIFTRLLPEHEAMLVNWLSSSFSEQDKSEPLLVEEPFPIAADD